MPWILGGNRECRTGEKYSSRVLIPGIFLDHFYPQILELCEQWGGEFIFLLHLKKNIYHGYLLWWKSLTLACSSLCIFHHCLVMSAVSNWKVLFLVWSDYKFPAHSLSSSPFHPYGGWYPTDKMTETFFWNLVSGWLKGMSWAEE